MRFAGHCWRENNNSRAIYCSGHLTLVKGRLVSLQSPTSINSVETRNAFQTTSLLCCRTVMDGVMDSQMTELARPDDDVEILNQKWPSQKLAGVIQFPSTVRISISSLSNATGQFVLFGCTKKCNENLLSIRLMLSDWLTVDKRLMVTATAGRVVYEGTKCN